MIALNMIVKNEAHCIRRCLESVLPYITAAVIVDTGSTDGTQELISDILCEVPHSVLQRPWKDFGFNRTEALAGVKRLLVLLAMLVGVGCSGPELDPGGLPPGWCRSHFCMEEAAAFAPAGEGMSDELASALARYRAATGRDDLGTDQSGIPVVWEDDLPLDSNGKENCGQTVTMGLPGGHMWTQVVRIDPHPSADCPSIQETLLHELIHAMAPNQSHAQHGLFARASEHDWIDEEALSALCSEFRCAAFNPER